MSKYHVGIDIGSLTVKVVALDDADQVREKIYRPSYGAPLPVTKEALEELFTKISPADITGFVASGSGGRKLAKILEIDHINELIAQTKAVQRYYPQVRTVIEIGGQDSKLLLLGEERDQLILQDFSLNTQCAAGTGSFLEQQAQRLGLTIEEFSHRATQAEKPPHIAGRCAVFAKSDIIHLQQVGTPLNEILAGLCFALARNFRSDIGRGKRFVKPILFQGGVSLNQGMIKAFEKILDLKEGELIIPEHNVLMAALGAVIIDKERRARDSRRGHREDDKSQDAAGNCIQRLADAIAGQTNHLHTPHAKLSAPVRTGKNYRIARTTANGQLNSYLGIDVGSISTKAVAIDEQGRLIDRVYLRTAGDPLRAVQKCLYKLKEMSATMLRNVRGVGVTGSGRELIGKFVGADLIKNEITAQVHAAVVIDPKVDTIIEIGGQDSKYIRLENGVVVDFMLNKVCAAGTGSFLEEQAARLGIAIDDFSALALDSDKPNPLGERCTVFIESDLIHHQQQGSSKNDLIAGLAYSVAYNYLNRVVGDRSIGEHVFFQGGVAGNNAVVAAFRNLLGREIIVPDHHEVTGAYGIALIAKEEMK
ncbi:acyl-CoA dehydratase activase [Candidatus Bipolaricaulota bacterium]|nr:acyl-CoA dehydratase activase [Candidatus Bipolaricaulota bacterium]HBR10455.1 hypothetical protein [Candidatus Acetothermia bacterium]